MASENRISYYRRKLGLSQEELGERLGVSPQTIERWEAGEESPSVDRLARLRTIFGVSVDEILGLTPDTATDPPSASAASVVAPTPPMPATPTPATPTTPPTTPRPMTAPLFDPSMYMPRKPAKPLRILSVVVAVLSIASIYVGMILSGILSDSESMAPQMFTEYAWILFFFLPIPVCSIVVGMIRQKKGFSGNANVAVGIIMCFFLILFGSTSFLVRIVENPVSTVAEELELTIPDYDHVSTSWSPVFSDNTVSTCVIHFSEANGDVFKAELTAHGHFLSAMPDHLKDVEPPLESDLQFDHVLLYDRAAAVYNTRPDSPTDMVALYFDEETDVLIIVTYRWEG